MSGAEFKAWRKRAGKTQVEVAKGVGVRQPFVCAVEKGIRPVTPALKNWLYSVCPEALASAPPACHAAPSSEHLKEVLGGLGYPGFRYLALTPGDTRPAEFVLDALRTEDLDQRVTDALPWVLVHRDDLDFRRLIDEARLLNAQNRLGFLLEVAVEAAKKVHLDKAVIRLEPWLDWLREARLFKEDTLCKSSLTNVEREWLRRTRSRVARYWRLLTDMDAKEVANVIQLAPA